MIRDAKSGWWAHALLALGIITVLTTVYGVWQHFTPVPIADQWDGGIGFYMRALQDPAHAFFEQHNEHRLAFSRLLFFADIRWFGGRSVSLLAGNLTLASALAFTVYRVTIHHAALSCRQKKALAGVSMLFGFSWMQSENFTWGFQSQWFAVYLFALCAFHALDLVAQAQERGNTARSNGWLIAAIASSAAAALSMSSGVLVFVVVLAQALYLRLTRLRFAALLIAALAVWIAYFASWQTPASSGSLTSALRQHPWLLVRYVLLYLGSPAERAHGGLAGAYLCGVIVLATLLFQLFRLIRNWPVPSKASSLFAVAAFIVGNAFITACGRLWFGLGTAFASRYTTASLMCWLALALFVLLNARARQVQSTAVVAILIGATMVVSYQRLALRADREETFARDVAGLALRAHVYTPELTKPVFPFPIPLADIAKDAEEARISIFAAGQPDYLVAPEQVVAASRCEGNIDTVSATSTPGVFEASGWIYAPTNRSVPRSIVVTDASGLSVGTGIAGGRRDDIAKLHGAGARFSQWTAFFHASPNTVIHVSGGVGRDFCQLSGDKAVVTKSY